MKVNIFRRVIAKGEELKLEDLQRAFASKKLLTAVKLRKTDNMYSIPFAVSFSDQTGSSYWDTRLHFLDDFFSPSCEVYIDTSYGEIAPLTSILRKYNFQKIYENTQDSMIVDLGYLSEDLNIKAYFVRTDKEDTTLNDYYQRYIKNHILFISYLEKDTLGLEYLKNYTSHGGQLKPCTNVVDHECYYIGELDSAQRLVERFKRSIKEEGIFKFIRYFQKNPCTINSKNLKALIGDLKGEH